MKAIVNVATSQYVYGKKRLRESLQEHYNGDVYMYDNEYEVESPTHQENPYAFKIYAIEKMRQMGYKQVLWLDASVYAVKNVQPLFDWIKEKGFFMEAAGHWTGTWCNDETLAYFGITRDEAMQMPMFSAGFTGLDFENPIAVEFFEKWKASMNAGCFRGNWTNHRHDMTCASIIANQMGLVRDWSGGGHYFAYIGEGYSQPQETVIFHLKCGAVQ